MLVKRPYKLSSDEVTVPLPAGLGDNKFVCFISKKESRHVMKAFWKDRKFEIKPPLESDIVLMLSLNFQETSQSKLQTPVFWALFQSRAGSLEGSYSTLTERGSGFAFPL